jgi:hypothetical protein
MLRLNHAAALFNNCCIRNFGSGLCRCGQSIGSNVAANRIALLVNRTLSIAIKCNVHPQNSSLSNHNTESVRRGGDTRSASPRMLSTDPPVRNRRQRRLGAIEHQGEGNSEVTAWYYAISVKLALGDDRSWPGRVCASERCEGRRLRRRRRAVQSPGSGETENRNCGSVFRFSPPLSKTYPNRFAIYGSFFRMSNPRCGTLRGTATTIQVVSLFVRMRVCSRRMFVS